MINTSHHPTIHVLTKFAEKQITTNSGYDHGTKASIVKIVCNSRSKDRVQVRYNIIHPDNSITTGYYQIVNVDKALYNSK